MTNNELRERVAVVCQRVLDYHGALVELAKDRTHGSRIRSDKLDRLYRAMVDSVRELRNDLNKGKEK
jgi:hypothetical protein